jgi:hypothetical protein
VKTTRAAGNLELARRIRAAGIPLHIPEDDGEARSVRSDGLRLRQYGGRTESTAFDLAGGTGFVIWLMVTAHLAGLAISAFELEVPWAGTVRCLEDPLEVDGTSTVYRFGGRDSLEFDREKVLNHQADVRRILPRGASIRGCLLAVGSQSIPDHFQHGETIPVFVNVYDQYTNAYRWPVSLWADRSEKLRPAAQPKAKRKGLFECLDPPGPLSHSERRGLS